ncbi:MAG: hypothetical protein WD598_04675 [Acidimicrobiia bacterium]
MSHKIPALALFVVVALLGAVALGAFGDDGPSIRAEPVTTTSEPTTSTSTEPPTSTTTAVAPTTDGQVVRYGGLELTVPTDWPVYDLAAEPRTCVRVDQHAVFLGVPGTRQDCPAHLVGHTETVLMTPLAAASEIAVARATKPAVLNGMSVLVDPNPDISAALIVVFPDLGLVAFLTYGETGAVATQVLSTFVLSS